jgi:hypothetical protein
MGLKLVEVGVLGLPMEGFPNKVKKEPDHREEKYGCYD